MDTRQDHIAGLTYIDPAKLKLGRRIGTGGFAVVFRADYDGLPVAVKVFRPPQSMQAAAAVAGDAAKAGGALDLYRRMFVQEAELCQQLNHPSIVRCHGLVELGAQHATALRAERIAGGLGMVLELCNGGSTADVVVRCMQESRRGYSTRQALEWLLSVARGVALLHGQQPPVIHRDIKQDNVLLSWDRRGRRMEARLADLGLAVRVADARPVMLRRKTSSVNGSTTPAGQAAAAAFVAISSAPNSARHSRDLGPRTLSRANTAAASAAHARVAQVLEAQNQAQLSKPSGGSTPAPAVHVSGANLDQQQLLLPFVDMTSSAAAGASDEADDAAVRVLEAAAAVLRAGAGAHPGLPAAAAAAAAAAPQAPQRAGSPPPRGARRPAGQPSATLFASASAQPRRTLPGNLLAGAPLAAAPARTSCHAAHTIAAAAAAAAPSAADWVQAPSVHGGGAGPCSRGTERCGSNPSLRTLVRSDGAPTISTAATGAHATQHSSATASGPLPPKGGSGSWGGLSLVPDPGQMRSRGACAPGSNCYCPVKLAAARASGSSGGRPSVDAAPGSPPPFLLAHAPMPSPPPSPPTAGSGAGAAAAAPGRSSKAASPEEWMQGEVDPNSEALLCGSQIQVELLQPASRADREAAAPPGAQRPAQGAACAASLPSSASNAAAAAAVANSGVTTDRSSVDFSAALAAARPAASPATSAPLPAPLALSDRPNLNARSDCSAHSAAASPAGADLGLGGSSIGICTPAGSTSREGTSAAADGSRLLGSSAPATAMLWRPEGGGEEPAGGAASDGGGAQPPMAAVLGAVGAAVVPGRGVSSLSSSSQVRTAGTELLSPSPSPASAAAAAQPMRAPLLAPSRTASPSPLPSPARRYNPGAARASAGGAARQLAGADSPLPGRRPPPSRPLSIQIQAQGGASTRPVSSASLISVLDEQAFMNKFGHAMSIGSRTPAAPVSGETQTAFSTSLAIGGAGAGGGGAGAAALLGSGAAAKLLAAEIDSRGVNASAGWANIMGSSEAARSWGANTPRVAADGEGAGQEAELEGEGEGGEEANGGSGGAGGGGGEAEAEEGGELVVAAGSFMQHMRRVASITQMLNADALPQFARPSLQWVYGLTGRAGSAMYMAPEVYRQEPYNEKVDVFSFGVLMYELLAGELLLLAYICTRRGFDIGVTTPLEYARAVASEGFRPPRTRAFSEDAWMLVCRCWHEDPCLRPSMEEVVDKLQELIQDPNTTMSAGCRCVIC